MRKATATLRYLRMAPRKVRLVASLLRGLPLDEAEAQLLLQRTRAAKPLLKLLRAAKANAKHTPGVTPATLYIESIRVDQGPMVKRFLPRARGRASPIQKKMSHVFLALSHDATRTSERFTIVAPKKVKLQEKKRRELKKESGEKSPGGTTPKPRRAGFFTKIFRRKSGM